MGLERLMARGGTPADIWSDNRANFIGAEKELLMCIEKWNQQSLSSKLANKGVRWKFNPLSPGSA